MILTPHISGWTLSQIYQDRIWDVFGSNLVRYLNREELLNLVDPAELV